MCQKYLRRDRLAVLAAAHDDRTALRPVVGDVMILL
jgi:hypothetical protein